MEAVGEEDSNPAIQIVTVAVMDTPAIHTVTVAVMDTHISVIIIAAATIIITIIMDMAEE